MRGGSGHDCFMYRCTDANLKGNWGLETPIIRPYKYCSTQLTAPHPAPPVVDNWTSHLSQLPARWRPHHCKRICTGSIFVTQGPRKTLQLPHNHAHQQESRSARLMQGTEEYAIRSYSSRDAERGASEVCLKHTCGRGYNGLPATHLPPPQPRPPAPALRPAPAPLPAVSALRSS